MDDGQCPGFVSQATKFLCVAGHVHGDDIPGPVPENAAVIHQPLGMVVLLAVPAGPSAFELLFSRKVGYIHIKNLLGQQTNIALPKQLKK